MYICIYRVVAQHTYVRFLEAVDEVFSRRGIAPLPFTRAHSFYSPEGWVFRLVRGAGGKGGRIKGFVLAVCGVRGGAGKEGWWMKFEYSRCFRGQSSLVRSGTVVIAVRLGGYFVP